MNEINSTIPASLYDSINKSCKINFTDFNFSHTESAIVSVRNNPFKKVSVFDELQKVPWAKDAYYLNNRIEFIKDPLFHAGCYYVQEASSMFLEQAIQHHLDLTKQVKILDLCASPGGKSTLINSLISDDSLLVSNEVIKSRVAALSENLTKWGTCNHVVCNNDPSDFKQLPDYFDAIIVDAPCSGSGLFRKQNEVITNWTEQQVEHCSLRQKRILDDVISSLKPGGTLIYSTCSFSTEENEEIVKWLIDEHQLTGHPINQLKEWNIYETKTANGGFGYRFFPHLIKGEGFFISVLKKEIKENDTLTYKRKKENNSDKISDFEINTLKSFLNNNEELKVIKQKEFYFLLSNFIERELHILNQLNIRKKGTLLGSFKNKDFIPDHELALSNFLNRDLSSLELNLDAALQFLKKSDVKPHQQLLPKGFLKINFQGKTIGWAKNLGNRINNYLPKDWRILKDISTKENTNDFL